MVHKVNALAQCAMQFTSYVIAQTGDVKLTFYPTSATFGNEGKPQLSR